MPRYEFKVIPAHRRGEKSRGVKTTEDRFALALTNLMTHRARGLGLRPHRYAAGG